MKKPKKTSIPVRYSVLYGFRRDDIEDVGYLRIHQTGYGDYGIYSIVEDIDDATRFIRGVQDNAVPFFNSEEELSAWKFHLVDVQN